MTSRSHRLPAPRALQERTEEELALVLAVGRGDRLAFERLYRLFYPRLFGYLQRILRRPDAAEEVVDDVMLAVWRGARRFESRSSASTWIFGIAYRQALKALRRRRRSLVESSAVELEEIDAVAPDSPERDLRAVEIGARLEAGLESLSPEHRTVITLTFLEGLSYRDIAEIVGCPENTVKTRMFHARRRLRALVPDLT